jgi:glycosyltransferase involved in cell wall biosynthesis
VKIAFLSPFYPYRGGIAQFGDSLYLALSKTNDVQAYTFTRQYPDMLFPGKTQYVSDEDTNRHINAIRILDSVNPLSYYKTAKEIINFNPDLLIISYWMPFFAPSLGKITALVKKKGIKVIGLLHNVIAHENRFYDRAFTKYFFGKCDGFIILNRSSEKDLKSIVPNAKCLIRAHPLYDHYGTKIDWREARIKLGIIKDKKVVLYFGFIRNYKGLDLLIKAFGVLDESYELVIAGEAYGDFKSYENLIEECGITKRVKLHVHYIEEKEIPVFFSAADVCVLPYRSATQSGIIGMAYHFNMPVIATNVGGLAEMIEDEKTGLIIDSPSSIMMSAKIREFFDTREYRNYPANIEKYKQKHSWDGFANGIISFYKTL